MRVAHFVSAFPVLSETFVQDEIQAFAQEGFENVVVCLRPPPPQTKSHPDEDRLLEDRFREDLHVIDLLDPLLSPISTVRCLLKNPFRTALVKASFHAAAISRPKEMFRLGATLWRTLESVPRLRELGIRHCHAHFAHYPASAAWGCSRILGTSFTWNAHSYDLHLYRAHRMRKIRDADRIFPVSESNQEAIFRMGEGIQGLAERVTVSRCGIRLEGYSFEPPPSSGQEANRAPLLLGVGRLVDTKGFATLIKAAKILSESGLDFQTEIVGEGPECERLEKMISELGMQDRVRLLGPLSREETREQQRRAAVVVQPCSAGTNGLDGIPVVLMEAMALGVPVVSTRFAGIPELVEEGVTGCLVEVDDAQGVADKVSFLLSHLDKAHELTRNARSRIENEYDASSNYRRKARMIGEMV